MSGDLRGLLWVAVACYLVAPFVTLLLLVVLR